MPPRGTPEAYDSQPSQATDAGSAWSNTPECVPLSQWKDAYQRMGVIHGIATVLDGGNSSQWPAEGMGRTGKAALPHEIVASMGSIC